MKAVIIGGGIGGLAAASNSAAPDADMGLGVAEMMGDTMFRG